MRDEPPYLKGQYARREGKRIRADNPYPSGTKNYRLWKWGWQKADRAIKRASIEPILDIPNPTLAGKGAVSE